MKRMLSGAIYSSDPAFVVFYECQIHFHWRPNLLCHEIYAVDVSRGCVSYSQHGKVPPDWFHTAEFNGAITMVYDFLFLV